MSIMEGWRPKIFLAVLVIAGIVLLFHDAKIAGQEIVEGGKASFQIKAPLNHHHTPQVIPSGDGTLTARVQEERDKFHDKLRRDYGDTNFATIFLLPPDPKNINTNTSMKQPPSRGRTIFTSKHGLSWSRLKRKLMIKILEAKIGISRRHDGTIKAEGEGEGTRLVWATGGHSAAAGHGNFLSEAYTAVLERAMKPAFASLGIEFVAKPYAMGSTSSGEEVALCIEQIFGDDIDILVWDYGMIDAARHLQWRQLLYTYHTALGKNRPAAIGMGFGTDRTRIKIYAELEELGMSVFHENQKVIKQMRNAIPDSQGLTDEEINQMSPFVQRLRCGAALEKGDPGCRDAKFNMTTCTSRKGTTSWHPGWKMHALRGNSMALFLMEALMDATEELEATFKNDDNLQDVLDRYIAEEQEAYTRVLESKIPDKLSPIANWILGSDDEVAFGNVNIRELYKRRSFCHTAMLPADIRYKGLLTQNYTYTGDWNSYDTGIPQPKQFEQVEIDNGVMRLAFDPTERSDCPENINIDFKDFFFVSSEEGWKSLTIPNDDEQKYYRFDTSNMMGMILLCLAQCEWGNCMDGDVTDQFDKGLLHMMVNDVPVVEYTKIGICWALKGEDNMYRWKPNSEQKFEIRARVDGQEEDAFSFARFSSFILV